MIYQPVIAVCGQYLNVPGLCSLLQSKQRLPRLFSGGFSQEAALTVIGVTPSTDEWMPVIDLTDKSLLQRQSAERYDIHPLLRQYAAEKLSALPEAMEEAASRHTSYSVNFLTQLGDGESPEQRALIRPERANIRMAWERHPKLECFRNWKIPRAFYIVFSVWKAGFRKGITLFQDTLTNLMRRIEIKRQALRITRTQGAYAHSHWTIGVSPRRLRTGAASSGKYG